MNNLIELRNKTNAKNQELLDAALELSAGMEAEEFKAACEKVEKLRSEYDLLFAEEKTALEFADTVTKKISLTFSRSQWIALEAIKDNESISWTQVFLPSLPKIINDANERL